MDTMHEAPETFAQVGSKEDIQAETWRLTDRLASSLRSIIFAEDSDAAARESLLNQSLDEFTTELRSRFPKWAKGEAVEKGVAQVIKAEPSEIVKIDEDEQTVFGWFNVVTKVDGAPLVDLHNDVIEPGEIEKAAYDFVLEYREGGQGHRGNSVATLVESMVFTPEKVAAMVKKGAGAVSLSVPAGWWWGGFRVHDREVFDLVKSGELSMFSIEGTATREEVEV